MRQELDCLLSIERQIQLRWDESNKPFGDLHNSSLTCNKRGTL